MQPEGAISFLVNSHLKQLWVMVIGHYAYRHIWLLSLHLVMKEATTLH